MTKKRPHLLVYIIENDKGQREEIEDEIEAVLCNSFLVEQRSFKDIEECRDYLHSTDERPFLVSADLYAAEDKKEETVYRVLLTERIPLLKRLREDLGPEPLLVVLSRYENFFESAEKRARIEEALDNIVLDGRMSKFSDDWSRQIKGIVEARFARGEQK